MNETAVPRDQAKDTIAISAATMGHDLVAALLGEVRNTPDTVAMIGGAHDKLVAERILQETLTLAGFPVSLGAVQAFTEAQFNEARAWVETYLTDPKTCTIERPSCIPAPPEGTAP